MSQNDSCGNRSLEYGMSKHLLMLQYRPIAEIIVTTYYQ